MRTLSSLGSKHLAHRKGRSALTALGIVLGVAILFGVLVSNATTQTGIDLLIEDFTGRADVIATPAGAFDATLPTSRARALGDLPDVEVVVPSFTIPSSLRTTDATNHVTTVELFVRGIELDSAQRIQNYELDAGMFFRPRAIEVIIPRALADGHGIGLGDRVQISTPTGTRDVQVVGIMTDTGAARSDEGGVAFTSIEAARILAGAGDVVSGARLVLAEGTDVDGWIDAHGDDAQGLDLQNAQTIAEGFKDFVGILGTVFTFFAAITLFVGAFLIYLTLSMAVIERVRVYGTMRALGATTRQVRRVVVAEATVLGIVSTVIGLALGLLIARGLIVMVGNLFDFEIQGFNVPASAIVAGVTVGVVTTLISALIPARRAARLEPVVAMRGDYARETRLSRSWIAGLVAFALGVIASFAGAGPAGTPLILLGSVLLVPPLLRPLASLLGRATNRMARGVGDIAVLHLVKERSRSAYTLALLMVVMAMIFSIGGMQASMLRALDDSLDRQFGADLQVDAVGLGTFAPEVGDELRKIDGIDAVTTMRFAGLLLEDAAGKDHQSFARIIDPNTYFDVESFLFRDGTEQEVRRSLAEGGIVLMPEFQATELALAVGDPVAINTSQGRREFTLGATYVFLQAGPPELIMGLRDAQRFLNAGGANRFHLNVRDDADAQQVRARIEERLGDRYHFNIETATSLKEDARSDIGGFFNIFYAILLVAGIVGLLGLANTLAMSVLQRFREIGVLRAVGTTRSQVRRMVLVESATMGAVAFALSIPLGFLLSVLVLRSIESAIGFDVAYVYPASWLPFVLAFGVFVAVIAALAPGRRAAKLEVVGALQYE